VQIAKKEILYISIAFVVVVYCLWTLTKILLVSKIWLIFDIVMYSFFVLIGIGLIVGILQKAKNRNPILKNNEDKKESRD